MEQPGRQLTVGARAALAQNRPAIAHDLGLDEELRKRRMRRVGGGRRKHDLGVTRHIERAPVTGGVRENDAAHLDVVLGGYDDFCGRIDPVLAPVEHRSPGVEKRLEIVGSLARRLIGRRPELSARDIVQITEGAEAVGCCIVAPTRERKVLPAAVPAPARCDEHVITAVRQQLDTGGKGRRVGARAHRGTSPG